MSFFDRIAEEKIRRAQEEGAFENLAGFGKPLQLDDNPHEPEGAGAAYRLLKENGFSLPWIEEGREIEADRIAARRLLAESGPGDQALRAFSEQIERLNRRIVGYNLRVPAPIFQRGLLDTAAEVQAALAGYSQRPSGQE